MLAHVCKSACAVHMQMAVAPVQKMAIPEVNQAKQAIEKVCGFAAEEMRLGLGAPSNLCHH